MKQAVVLPGCSAWGGSEGINPSALLRMRRIHGLGWWSWQGDSTQPGCSNSNSLHEERCCGPEYVSTCSFNTS